MPPRIVLVTGVSRYLGARLAELLQADASIERILGVDVARPAAEVRRALHRTEFVRADIRNPTIAKVIGDARVDTVVHLNVVGSPFDVGGRTAMKELNIIGTMQLVAACQQAPSVRRFVLKSTTAIYGSSPRDPALFAEDTEPRGAARAGYERDATEVERYVRGFARRRPGVTATLLRFANILGPGIDTPLTRYLSLPVVPTVLGFDPRLQFCHESDALEVLRRATLEEHPGTFNVAGEGVLLLSQAVRRAGRVALPVLSPALSALSQLVRGTGAIDLSPEQLRFLSHGRAVDITALRKVFGYPPAYTTRETFDDFVATRLAPVAPPGWLRRAGRAASGFAAGWRESGA